MEKLEFIDIRHTSQITYEIVEEEADLRAECFARLIYKKPLDALNAGDYKRIVHAAIESVISDVDTIAKKELNDAHD